MTKLLDNNINTEIYWDEVYKNEFKHGKHRTDLERFEKVSGMIKDGTNVIDIGCGSGEFVQFLHERKKNCKITGIDFSKVAIDEAKKNYRDCEFFAGDVMSLSNFSDLDYAVCFETIEHLSEPSAFIDEVNKILKKDGIFFLSTPYNNMVSGGQEHITSFIFQDMVDYFEKSDKWIPIIIMRYSANLKNMMVITKKT